MTAGSDIDLDLLRRVAWLDLSDAQIRFQQDLDPGAFFTRTQTSLEYRRFLLMRLAHPGLDIAAPPLIDRVSATSSSGCPTPRRAHSRCTALAGPRATRWRRRGVLGHGRHRARRRLCGFRRYLSSWAAPAPQNWHFGLLIARLIAERTGAVVAPIGAYFNYYRDGDCVSIHNDGHGYDLVLLTLLGGPVEPLHCHVHLADTPLDEIQRLAQATNGRPDGATPLDVSSVPLPLSGQRIPHHREPQQRDEEPSSSCSSSGLVTPTRPVP